MVGWGKLEKGPCSTDLATAVSQLSPAAGAAGAAGAAATAGPGKCPRAEEGLPGFPSPLHPQSLAAIPRTHHPPAMCPSLTCARHQTSALHSPQGAQHAPMHAAARACSVNRWWPQGLPGGRAVHAAQAPGAAPCCLAACRWEGPVPAQLLLAPPLEALLQGRTGQLAQRLHLLWLCSCLAAMSR